MQRSIVEKFHSPQGANGSAQYVTVGTFTALRWHGDHVGKNVNF